MSREEPTFGDRAGAGLRTAAVTGGLIFGADAIGNVFRNTFQRAGRPIISSGTWKFAAGAAVVVGALNFIFRTPITNTIDQRREARNEQQGSGEPAATAESTKYRDIINAQRAAALSQTRSR